MLFEADINSTHYRPSGFEPIKGIVTSWRLGYNGETGSIVILFPLMAFVLILSIAVIVLGARTGISHVSRFDPTNTTHIIIARYVTILPYLVRSLMGSTALLVAAMDGSPPSMEKTPFMQMPRH